MSKIVLANGIVLPNYAYVEERKRYKADSIIHFLKSKTGKDTITIGLTNLDISTNKNNRDWGIMGLGYQPGNACVVSTFRLNKKKKKEQLLKLIMHEVGHNLGLPHCPIDTCFMRDAEGKNHFDEEINFCKKCKEKLVSKGLKNI